MPLRIRSARRRLVFMLIALALLAVSLSACNTVQGIGEDITSAGKTGQDIIEGN